MKNFKIFFLAVILGSVALFAGCAEDPTQTPGDQPAVQEDPNCYGVYLPEQAFKAEIELDPADPTEVVVKVMRTKAEDEISVPITVAGPEGIFEGPEAVDFADGQTEVEFTVSFAAAEVGVPYSCTIFINDDPLYVSVYSSNATGLSFTVTRVKWIDCNPNEVITYEGEEYKGYSWYTEAALSEMFNFKDGNGDPVPGNAKYPVKVQVRADSVDPDYPNGSLAGLYRMIDPYGPGTPYYLGPGAYVPNTIFYIDATNPGAVYFDLQPIGTDLGEGYGLAYMWTLAGYYKDKDDEASAAAYYGKIDGGAIVFPKDALFFYMPTYGTSLYQTNANGDFCLEICAAQVVDFTLKLTAGESAEGVIDIEAEFGADVAKVEYAFFETALDEKAIKANSKAMDADEIETEEITATGTISTSFEATGLYTMVANIYDEADELRATESVSFGYVAAGEEVPVVMGIGLDVTNKYANKGYTAEDSVEAYIYGTDIVSGYWGVFPTEDLAEIPAAAYADLVAEEGNEFTEEEIAAINGDGFSKVVGNLMGGTEYTLIVTCFNGYVSKTMTDMAMTEGTPHPLKRPSYTANDIIADINKEDLLAKTYNLWAVDYYDETNTKRQKLGSVSFSENTELDDPANEVDAINIKGLTMGTVAEDTIPCEYYNGVICFYKPGAPFGSFTFNGMNLYLNYLIVDMIGMGAYSAYDYLMLAGCVEEGYLAVVCDPYYADSFNFSGMLQRAYMDEACTQTVGNWAFIYDIMFEDTAVATANVPTAAPTAGQLKALSQEISVEPTNFVELRGRERIHALIDEMMSNNKKIRNAAVKMIDGEMPAGSVVKAKTSFSAGVKKAAAPARFELQNRKAAAHL